MDYVSTPQHTRKTRSTTLLKNEIAKHRKW